MNDIRRALEAAVKIEKAPTRFIVPEKHVAEIIAAFFRALPTMLDYELHLPGEGEEPYPWFDAIADAVLAAANEEWG